MRAALRRVVELMPLAPELYRGVRDTLRVATARPTMTRHGFLFAGSAHMAAGEFEPLETAWLERELPLVDAFVDVGANIGFYTCLARRLGKRVVAVEPLHDNVELLLGNLAANGWDDVETFPLGLSDRPGLAPCFGAATGASLLPGWAGATSRHRRFIALSTLDIVVGDRFAGQRLLIKVDVEGAEASLLRGATATLRATPRPAWLVEVVLTEHHPGGLNPRFLETFDAFWSAGYEAFVVGSTEALQRAEVARWVEERRAPRGYNYVFR